MLFFGVPKHTLWLFVFISKCYHQIVNIVQYFANSYLGEFIFLIKVANPVGIMLNVGEFAAIVHNPTGQENTAGYDLLVTQVFYVLGPATHRQNLKVQETRKYLKVVGPHGPLKDKMVGQIYFPQEKAWTNTSFWFYDFS